MTKKYSFKAVIFDLDGTLLDTLEDITDSVNKVLAGMDLSVYSSEQVKYFVGQGMEVLAHRVLPEKMLREALIKTFVERLKAEYGKRWAEKTRPYDGIPEVLAELSAMEVILNVFSNKADEFVRSSVRFFFNEITFAHVLGSRPDRPNKPDPAGALYIASALSLSPEECVFIGDTHTDMETAVAAGMYPVGVLWGFRTEEELRNAGAVRIFRYPLDILNFFRQNNA
ncbi:MAG: HAD family hydrolase [Candidatus Aminicenantes bacterium]|nr:HAD family hydrolase [Candidatus Aminicenantes bacterium]